MKRFVLIFLISFIKCFIVEAQHKPNVYFEEVPDGFQFYGDNASVLPYSVKLEFTEIKNLNSTIDWSTKVFVLEAHAKHIPLFKLITEKGKALENASFSFGYHYSKGNVTVKNELNYNYLLPFEHGTKRKVGQGNFGPGTHKSIYAIDFDMPINTKIFSARDGVVSDVKEDSDRGGNNRRFESDGNYVEIYHSDGTFANYVHLKQYGSVVSVGDKVKKGQLIGYSGNTGWSSGPHLHFSLNSVTNFENKTIPAKFLQQDGSLIIPEQGRFYYAYHPGKGSFEEEKASKFSEAVFENEKLVANSSDKLEITKDEYAEFILFYVDNGKDFPLQGTLKIELNNMESTKKLPYTFTVKAHEKKYLLAIKPADLTKNYGYKIASEFKQLK